MLYRNPVWSRDFPDPFLLAHNGVFYAYATETAGKPGFQALRSRDLVHWEDCGVVFRPGWADKHFWAPEVQFQNGVFHLTYSALNGQTGRHDIGLAIGKSPLGPFRHQTVLVRAGDREHGVIDATIFAQNGRTFLVYCVENPRRIVMRRLAPNGLSVDGPPVDLIRPDQSWEHGVVEAPTLLWRESRYHLFYSAGPYEGNKDGPSYCIAHALSRRLEGPYEKTGRVAVSRSGQVYGPGHQSFLTLPSGETWLAYHAWDAVGQPRYGANPSGRTLRLDRINWGGRRGDIPVLEGPSTAPIPAPKV